MLAFALRLCLCLALICSGIALAGSDLQPYHVAVVYNSQSRASRECAELYQRTRRIPAENMLPLSIPMQPRLKDISQAQFETLIACPLLQLGSERNLHFPASRRLALLPIRAMVLMPDLPLRIKAAAVPKGAKAKPWQQTLAASVDSELAQLGSESYPRDRMLANPLFGRSASLTASMSRYLSVCRIDSPSVAVSKRMILRPIEVEAQGGLQGWTVVDYHGPYASGDKWFRTIVDRAIEAGQPVFVDGLRSSLPEHFPMPTPTVMYFGWYEGSANGPFRMHYPKGVPRESSPFRFAPGAVAMHLHSFSATDVTNLGEGWAGALLMRGADVSSGNVWEPYLGGGLRQDVFYERLLQGYCVAEAAAHATPQLSWMGVVLGDPLYRPYPSPPAAVALNPGMRACRDLAQGRYDDALDGMRFILKRSDDDAVLMRTEYAVIEILLLQGKRAEAKAYMERLLLRRAGSDHLYMIRRMLAQHFLAPKPKIPVMRKGEKVKK